MRIAISASADNLEAQVTPVFGRCEGFIIVEEEDGKIKSHQFIDNPGKNAMGGAGIVAARAVVDQKVEAVITGNLGPNAGMIVEQAEIKAFQAPGMTVKEAVAALAEGKLEAIKGSTVNPDYGKGPGFGGRGQGRGGGPGFGGRGQGMGRGRGQGQGLGRGR